MNTIYNYTVTDIPGHEISLEEFRGKTLLIVNTPVKRYAPADRPLKIIPEIEELLGVQLPLWDQPF